MAPEQELGNALPASDIYSMGIVTYQMLTGLLPFEAMILHRCAEIPPPSTLNTLVPTAVDAVIERVTDREPAKRYSSASDFAAAFNAALAIPQDIEDMPTMPGTLGDANVIVRTIMLENQCRTCGQENRSTARFCRNCRSSLTAQSPLITEVCQVGYRTDVGRRYIATENQDMLLIVQGLCVTLAPPHQPFGLFAVADGLRGLHDKDKSASEHEASRLVIKTVADVLLPLLIASSRSSSSQQPLGAAYTRDSGNPTGRSSQPLALPPDTIIEQWLRQAVWQANRVVYHYNDDHATSMGSTLTAAMLHKRTLYVASVGDSRAYHYSASKGLERITTDHTLAATQVDAKLLQPDEIYTSAARNQHYRYLGKTDQVRVDLFQRQVEVNDLILLCTDGLWHMVRDDRLTGLLGQGDDAQKLADTLIDAANMAGGDGNISAIVVRIL